MRSKTRSQKTSVAVASSSLDSRGSCVLLSAWRANTSAIPRKSEDSWLGGYSTGSLFARIASMIFRILGLGVFMVILLENVKCPPTGETEKEVEK